MCVVNSQSERRKTSAGTKASHWLAEEGEEELVMCCIRESVWGCYEVIKEGERD